MCKLHGTPAAFDDSAAASHAEFLSKREEADRQAPERTEAQTKRYLAWMRETGRVVPVHYQEPFRRGYGKWQPRAEDFVVDLRGAKNGGAAGWCFHNGDTRDAPEGRPRRSFDLREKRLFDDLDAEERRAAETLRATLTR